MTKKYFELSNDKSAKFWEIERKGRTLTVRFGKKGTAGQLSQKEFSSTLEAEKSEQKSILEKSKKGYIEVKGAGDLKGDSSLTPEQLEWQRQLKMIYGMSAASASQPAKRDPEFDVSAATKLVREGNIKKLKSLFGKRKLVDFDEIGFELLSSATTAEMVDYLLSIGASVVSDNDHAVFALIRSAASGYSDLSALRELCAREGELFYLNNIWDDNGDYPIHVAVLSRSIPVVEVICDAGGDLALRSNSGESAIGYAAKRDERAMVGYLISAGSPVKKKDFYLNPAMSWDDEELKLVSPAFQIDRYVKLHFS